VKNLNELNFEIELIKKDINDIKINHLQHIEKDLKEVKTEVFKFKYIAWTAIVIFVLATDKFTELLRLL
jgi:archaellum component FlaC